MKKFLLCFVLYCLMTVSMGKPSLAGDINVMYGLGVVLDRSWVAKVMTWVAAGEEVDRPPFAAEDSAWIEAHSSDFLPRFLGYKNAPAGVGAAYNFNVGVFDIPDSFYTYPLGVQEAMLHHETQHMKDAKKLLDAGYTMTSLMLGYLDPTSEGILQGILEARAYGEEIVWVYNKMKYYEKAKSSGNYSGSAVKDIEELYEKYKEAYEFFLDEDEGSPPFYKVFDDAIKAGESVEKARHSMEVEVLNSDVFAEYYLKSWVEDMKFKSDDFIVLSIPDILGALADDKNSEWLSEDELLHEEDIYAADKFWINLCSYEKTKYSYKCNQAKQRYQNKNCELTLCLKWDDFISKYVEVSDRMNENFDVDVVFKKMDKIFEFDKSCVSKACKDKKRILTTEDDENFYKKGKDEYRTCCTLDWDFKDLQSKSESK